MSVTGQSGVNGQTTMAKHHEVTTSRKSTEVDTMSKKGVFGWDIIGETNIPYILRGTEPFVSVRMVESRVLCHYPSTYPEELSKRPPLASEFVTPAEATLLNEINRDHCDHEFGYELFTTADIIVRIKEFRSFFEIVQKYFDGPPREKGPAKKDQSPLSVTGGWLQVNNTVIPYVNKHATKYIPLSVVRFAAGLLVDVEVDGFDLTKEECSYLNEICSDASLTFEFTLPTRALPINLVCQMSKEVVHVKELPKQDPFSHAEHTEEIGVNLILKSQRSASASPQPSTSKHQAHHTEDPMPLFQKNRPSSASIREEAKRPVVSRATTHTVHHQTALGPGLPRNSDSSSAPAPGVMMHTQPTALPCRARLPRPLERMQALQDRFLPPRSLSEKAANTVQKQQLAAQKAGITHLSSAVNRPMYHPRAMQQMLPQQHMYQQQQLHHPMQVDVQHKENNMNRIKAVDICGKTVSCLVNGTGQYALIEAVCKVFFPETDLQEFQFAIESILQVPIHRLTRQEERAFLNFYELPANSLSCQAAINIKHFPHIMSTLRQLFSGEALSHKLYAHSMKRPIQGQREHQHGMPSKSRKLEDAVQKLATRASHSSTSRP